MCVITLTCDFNLFAACIAANLTAILLTVVNLALAGDVRAFVVFLVGPLSNSSDHGLSNIARAIRRQTARRADDLSCRFAAFLSCQTVQANGPEFGGKEASVGPDSS